MTLCHAMFYACDVCGVGSPPGNNTLAVHKAAKEQGWVTDCKTPWDRDRHACPACAQGKDALALRQLLFPGEGNAKGPSLPCPGVA